MLRAFREWCRRPVTPRDELKPEAKQAINDRVRALARRWGMEELAAITVGAFGPFSRILFHGLAAFGAHIGAFAGMFCRHDRDYTPEVQQLMYYAEDPANARELEELLLRDVEAKARRQGRA